MIKISNFEDFKNIIESNYILTKFGKVVIFTNGNSWYINTLINNMIKSMKIFEKNFVNKLIVFCSDKEAEETSRKLNFNLYKYINIPKLQVSDITTDSPAGTSKYTRICFFKTVLMRQIMEMGYIPLYLDPDMAFIKPAVDDMLNYLENSDFVCAGIPQYINSNIMISKPTTKNLELFKLSVEDLDNILEANGFDGDEDLLRPRLGSINFSCLNRNHYPSGADVKKVLKTTKIIHANCVKGLKNKIQLIKECGAWFLELIPSSFMPPVLNKFPPLLTGDLIEKYFDTYISFKNPKLNRRYINVGWTNLYCNSQFKKVPYRQDILQLILDKLPRDGKYFTICQYAGKIREKLPPDTLVYGGSEGDYPLPLIYENEEFFSGVKRKTWSEKKIFCSFVGQHTHNVRRQVKKYIEKYPDYYYFEHPSGSCDYNVEEFISNTLNSKFVLAPRGFGRSSFRFFECLKLGSIPIYIWDDKCWLPFQDVIDYNKLCINIRINELPRLDIILRSITEEYYNEMIEYGKQMTHKFTFEGISEEIVKHVNNSI